MHDVFAHASLTGVADDLLLLLQLPLVGVLLYLFFARPKARATEPGNRDRKSAEGQLEDPRMPSASAERVG